MKRVPIIILALLIVCWFVVASCTPPPPKQPDQKDQKADTVKTDTSQPDINAPAGEEKGEGASPGVVTSPGEGTEPGEVTEPGSTSTDTTKGDNMTKSGEIPKDIFGQYKTWPPEKITPEEVAQIKNLVVVLETTKGIIKIKLSPDEAPIHSANFVKLVQEGYYNGITFHRVIADFMTQGGDPKGTGEGGPSYTLPAEIKLPHETGSIAAARTGDNVNPQRRSSGSQFYMVRTRERCAHLDKQYTVFGKIIQGQDINLAIKLCDPCSDPDKIIKAWVEPIAK